MRSRPAIWLGEVSFAFYLVHSLVLRLVVEQLGWDHDWSLVAGLGIMAIIFSLTLAVSAILHRAIERPMQRVIARRAPRAIEPSPAVAAERAT